tara:strand:- start:1970 stop:2896 length:927 start_codon:yes stop_codon:yes gene_type:complete
MKIISVIIPVYNNQQTLLELYKKLVKVFAKVKQNYQIIFIDDGSKDQSYNKIKKICLKNKKVSCIKLSKNFGQRFALMAGLKYSTGDYLINIDADLQDPPELIEKIYNELRKNNHIVLAARNSSSENIFRKLSSFIQHRFLNYLIQNYPKEGFTVFGVSKKVVQEIKDKGNNISLLQLEILNYGYTYKIIYYDRNKRQIGKSQFNFSSRLNLAIEMITLTTSSLLRFCLLLGFILLLASFSYIAFVIYTYFYIGTPFPGYSPIIIVSLFLGGLNIFVLGVLSEYVSIILRETRSYNKFNVQSFLNKPK